MSVSSTKLEQEITKALKDGFEATFLYGAKEEGSEIALKFAKAAAPGITNAICSYIDSGLIVGSPLGLISPTGPVTGVLTPKTLKINFI